MMPGEGRRLDGLWRPTLETVWRAKRVRRNHALVVSIDILWTGAYSAGLCPIRASSGELWPTPGEIELHNFAQHLVDSEPNSVELDRNCPESAKRRKLLKCAEC